MRKYTDRMSTAMARLQKTRQVLGIIETWSTYLAMIILFVMVVLSTINVVMRFFFTMALHGFYEVTELAMVAMIFLAIGYTMKIGGHVTIDILAGRFSLRTQAVISVIVYLLVLFVMAILIWGAINGGLYHWRVGSFSNLLHIPDYPFRFVIAFGSFLLLAEALFLLLDSVAEVRRKR